MDKIVIKDRVTGAITHELPADQFQLARAPAKQRKRKLGIFTEQEFEGLCAAVLSGTRGGKRIDAARRVMTQGISCTEAAHLAGITASSVTELVLQLENHYKKARSAHHEQYTTELKSKIAEADIEKPKQAEGPAKMPYQEFMHYMNQLPQSMKVRSANDAARLMLTQNTPIKHVHRSYVGADLGLAQALVDKIREMKALDESNLLNDFE